MEVRRSAIERIGWDAYVDGTHRRYGLGVPAHFDDPVAAAGWCYGLSGEMYRHLARRT